MVHTESWAAPARTRDPERGESRSTLSGMFRRWATGTPDTVAVWSEQTTMTYAELDAASAEIADWLRTEGPGVGGRVAIALPVSPRYVAAAVGAAKAGVAYVSLDPATPPARLAQVVEATGASALITADGLRSHRRAEGRTRRAAGPHDVALVVYTSGSTGSPRAVALDHRGLVGAVGSLEVALGPGDRVPMLASVAFDASAFELWATLGRGATLVLPPRPGEVRQVVARHGVTGMLLTSALFRAFVDEGGADAARGLRWVLVGGEELSAAHAATFTGSAPGCALYNCYGPTETTVFATWHRVGADDGGRVPIGTAVLGKRVHLLGDDLAPTPAGQVGEIFVGGAGLAQAYLGAPGATAERFVPDPTGPPGSRMYRTGDLASGRSPGVLVFAGRRDRQVKISGHRVDPAEIEAVLLRHPDVVHAAVVVRTRPNGRPALCAYVARTRTAELSTTAVRDWLGAELPPYLVPPRVMVVDSMALTPNGKVDHRALPVAWSARDLVDVDHVPPRTDLEDTFAEIWGDVLGIAEIGVLDNFFDLGGDSLSGIELTMRIATTVGVELSARDLIENQTVAELAGLVAGQPEQGAP